MPKSRSNRKNRDFLGWLRNRRVRDRLTGWKVIVITDTFDNPLSEERIVEQGHGLISPGFACCRGRSRAKVAGVPQTNKER